MTFDKEKYQNICICNIGIRNRSQPYLWIQRNIEIYVYVTLGLETDHNRVYTLDWVHKKIRIYPHMTFDKEKYQNICVCNIGIRNRPQPYLYVALGTKENQNFF